MDDPALQATVECPLCQRRLDVPPGAGQTATRALQGHFDAGCSERAVT